MQIETLTRPTCVKKIETALSNLAGVSNESAFQLE